MSTDADSNAGITGYPACDDFQEGTALADAGEFQRSNTTPPTFPQGCLNIETQITGSFTTVTAEAAYVLISHGPNTSGGYASEVAAGAARTNAQGAGNLSQEENDAGNCDDTGAECRQGGTSNPAFHTSVILPRTLYAIRKAQKAQATSPDR